MIDLAEIALPARMHIDVQTGRDVITGGQIKAYIIWADRTYGQCPRCRQPVPRDPGCPGLLNPGAGQGGQVDAVSQEHGCGEWLSVIWDFCGEPDLRAVRSLVVSVEAERRRQLESARVALAASLTADLAAAVARLGEPYEEGEDPAVRREEVRTGWDMEPGVYLDLQESGQWIAWDYDPDGAEGEAITIYPPGGEWVVMDSAGVALMQREPVLGYFASEDKAAGFISTLPGAASGRYSLDAPADEPQLPS
jgi:hypothetical protein